MFISSFEIVGLVNFPEFTGLRIMHMPFYTGNPRGSTIETCPQYGDLLARLCDDIPVGVGYLTIDEAFVRAGEYHRRPGLHVDGIDERGSSGGWGGGGGWGSSGMLVASSHVGCRAYAQTFEGWPVANGDCSALEPEARNGQELASGVVYQFSGMTVHESLPQAYDCHRQFLRISFPSDAAWYEGYTRNPQGIEPTGEIRPRRAQMNYRP